MKAGGLYVKVSLRPFSKKVLQARVAPNVTGSHVTAEHLRKTNFPKKNLRLTNFPKKIHWQFENPKYWASHLCFRRSPREFARIVLDAQEFHGFQDIRLGAAKLRAKLHGQRSDVRELLANQQVSCWMCGSSTRNRQLCARMTSGSAMAAATWKIDFPGRNL